MSLLDASIIVVASVGLCAADPLWRDDDPSREASVERADSGVAAPRFSIPNHEGVTSAALAFLKDDVLQDMADEHTFVDVTTQLLSKWHFDGCQFRQASRNIKRRYSAVINAIRRRRFSDAADTFGRLLHPVQDFYAHSNWVDMGRSELVDSGLGNWKVLAPWSTLPGNVVVVQGEDDDVPAGWSLSRVDREVTVEIPGEGSRRGLISGTFFGPDDCANSIAMTHDELNKDDEGRPNHAAARALAIQQTRHEYCRLEALVRRRLGPRALQRLQDAWIADPAGNPCGSS